MNLYSTVWGVKRRTLGRVVLSGNVISRAVRPTLEHVTDEEEVLEIERARLMMENRTIAWCTGLMTSQKLKEARQLRQQRHAHRPSTVEEVQEHLSARISRTGAGGNTVCLVVESAPNINDKILVKTRWR